MGPWGTYELSDLLMFSPETYYRLFERINAAVWPLQLAALALGAAIPLLLGRSSALARLAAALLSASWLGVAWAYHLQRYSQINWAAPGYAVLFAAEALLLIWIGVIRGKLGTQGSKPLLHRAGLVLLGFGLVVYPLLNPLQGHGWMRAEVFGIAPDPTAVGTFGILLMAGRKASWFLWIAPVVWCLLTGATLWALGTPQAILPPLAALLAIVVAVRRGDGGHPRCRRPREPAC